MDNNNVILRYHEYELWCIVRETNKKKN